MTMPHKILWTEGTLLGQQHFQQWDDYHTARLNFLSHIFSPWLNGVRKLIIDEASLSVGQLIIKQCQAIFPQGLLIDYDARHDEPLSILLQKTCDIYLAVSLSTTAKNVSGYRETSITPAWSAHYEKITDMYDVKREREVGFLKPNVHLLRDTDDRSGFYSIKILAMVQESAGGFSVMPYIPPSLHIHTSAVLQDLLRAQLEILSSKIRLLRGRRGSTSFNQNDLTDFFLLQLFNQTFPQLEFYYRHPEAHPNNYYLELSKFLSTISSFTDPIVLPDYQHDDLYQTFSTLDKIFKALVETVIPSRMSALKLIRENDVLYSVESIDSRVFEKNSFYLAVFFEAETVEWLTQFMRQVKIGARSMIESIVASALPGLRLVHTQRPPNKLAVKSGYEYFYIEPSGNFWDHIKTERTLAIFTSYDFIKAQIELVTVEE